MPDTSLESPASIIGPDTLIRGEVTFSRAATVMGRIEGHVSAQDALEIAPSGVVIGDITGVVVDIEGQVEGNVVAQTAVRLGPTARLHGELHSANLAISEGATFIGKVFVGAEEPAEPEEPARSPTTPTATASEASASRPAAEPETGQITVAQNLSVAPQPAPAAARPEPSFRVVTQTLQQAQQAAMRSGKVIKAR